MSKEKTKNSIWWVLFEGIKIYFSNIDKFVMFMLFPVFGQILGIALTFSLTIGFAGKISDKVDSISAALFLILLLVLAGLLIFMKAFWDYMVAYVALNSMTEGALTTGKVYDFRSHREVATRRTFKFIGLLTVIAILSAIGSSIFFIIPAIILWIYFILVFQVFTFEPELSIKQCFKRSLNLVKGDWGRTFLLAAILGFFSIYIITEGVTVIFDYLRLTDNLSGLFDFVGNSLQLDLVNKILLKANAGYSITVDMISKAILSMFISIIVAEFTLPIRSICWTLWYKNLSNIKGNNFVEKVKTTKKKKKEIEE